MVLKKLTIILAILFTFGVMSVPSFAESQAKTFDVVIRDFKADGKLFEGAVGDMKGLVQSQLGADRKPVFSDPKNPTWPISLWQTWGVQEPVSLYELQAFFNDTSGRNLTTGQQLAMEKENDGFYTVDMRELTNQKGFFPIDTQLFGNEGKQHNYHFTVEHHSCFVYNGSESLTVAGDGDIWVFIGGRLVIDMGGVHTGQQSTISIHDLVKNGVLNIKKGDYVPFDLFFIERHSKQSNLYIRTSIDLVKFKASVWAQPELDKADRFDLLPPSLKYADMTKYITREEFTELAVRLYGRISKDALFLMDPNPFTDTDNKEILKAVKLGIAAGTSATTFSPKELISREQVASIWSRTIRKLFSNGDYSTAGAPVFKDQTDISAWALEHVLYMSKTGLMNGTGGIFMPRAVTSAQKAAGYGNTTREQAAAMSVRIFLKYANSDFTK